MDAFAALESQTRLVLISSLFAERRTLVLGVSDPRAVKLAAEQSPKELVVTSQNVQRLRLGLGETTTPVEALSEPGMPLGFRNESFDLIVCFDLQERMTKDARWPAELRRILSVDGYFCCAVPQDGATLGALGGQHPTVSGSYRDLVRHLAQDFGTLTAFAQTPFVGSMFVGPHSVEGSALALERMLIPDNPEGPGAYVLVFGPKRLPREELSLVELSFAPVAAHLQQWSHDKVQAAVARLERLCDASEQQAQRYVRELEQQSSEVARLRAELGGLQAKLDEREQTLVAKTESIATTQKVVVAQEAELRLALSRAEKSDEARIVLQAKRDELEKLLASRTEKDEATRQALLELQAKHERATATVQSLESKVAELHQGSVALQAAHKTQLDALAGARSAEQVLTKECGELRARLQSLAAVKTEVQDARAAVEEQSRKVRSLQAALKESEQREAELRDQLAEQAERLLAFDQREVDEGLERQAVMEQDQRTQALESELSLAHHKLRELESARDGYLAQERESLALRTEQQVLNAQIERSAEELRELRAKLSEATAAPPKEATPVIDVLEVTRVREALSQAVTEKKEKADQVSALATELASEKQRLTTLEFKYQELEKRFSELSAADEKRRQLIKDAFSTREAASKELLAANEALMRERNQRESTDAQLHQEQSRAEQLLDEMSALQLRLKELDSERLQFIDERTRLIAALEKLQKHGAGSVGEPPETDLSVAFGAFTPEIRPAKSEPQKEDPTSAIGIDPFFPLDV